MKCEQCESVLFEFNEGSTPADLSAEINAHLESCDACAQLLNDIWQMGLVSSRWRDESVPLWNRRQYFFSRSSWQFPQLLATAASLLALVLVLSDVHFVTGHNGITLKAGRSDYVSQSNLALLKTEQDGEFDQRFQRLTAQQVASNRLMFRTLLERSRQERREDFTTLVSYWNESQAAQARETEDQLRYLLASQADDERDIQQLSDAFQQIRLRRGNDM